MSVYSLTRTVSMTIQSPTKAIDGMGTPVESFSGTGTIVGKLDEFSGRESLQWGNAKVRTQTHVFYADGNVDIETNQRLTYTDDNSVARTYQILGVSRMTHPLTGLPIYTKLDLEEVR